MTAKSNISTRYKDGEISYPVLMKSIPYEFVVLFTEKDKGTVVYDPKGAYGLGYYSDCWVEATEACEWTQLEETVEISN